VEQLAAMIQSNKADSLAALWCDSLSSAMEEYEINTVRRMSIFLSQAGHECRWFSKLEEDLHYKPKTAFRVFRRHFTNYADCVSICSKGPQALANRVYANRMGNGDESSGDGWKFRGEGIFQITGENNFLEIQEKLGIDLISNPSVAKQPEIGSRMAAYFFSSRGCKELSDVWDVDSVSRKVNGGDNGLIERRHLADMVAVILDED